jgi:hypothetical protein
MSEANKDQVPTGDTNAAHDLRRVPLGAITGTLCGALIGAGMMGYTQFLQATSGLHDIEMGSVFLNAVAGGIGGAIIGTAIGLITGLILAGRNRSGKGVRLR